MKVSRKALNEALANCSALAEDLGDVQKELTKVIGDLATLGRSDARYLPNTQRLLTCLRSATAHAADLSAAVQELTIVSIEEDAG